MTTQSDNFEKQIKRIKELLESSEAEIIWDDKIADPDTGQLRQIDITIRKDGKVTHVECRKRGSKQDVMWIEELVGRKDSLGADKMIAVSASGFTGPAILKAKAKGIFLRDLQTVTEEEIQSWGNKSTIRLGLYRYLNPKLELFFDQTLMGKIDSSEQENILAEILSTDNPILSDLLKLLREHLRKTKLTDKPANIKMRVFFEPNTYLVGGMSIAGAGVEGDFFNDQLIYETASVLLYGAPHELKNDRCANIELFDFEGFEITNKFKKSCCICVDISSIPFPKNSIFNGRLIVNFTEERAIKRIETVGMLDQSQFSIGKGTFNVGFVSE
ncbi:MAG: restriction endonuclease [Thermodesulfobacteriota bacterium]